ncbi:MAG: hypothetical protein ACQ9MH_18010, partial [Nitrospinales bacterium]
PDGIGDNLAELDNWTSLHLSPGSLKMEYCQNIWRFSERDFRSLFSMYLYQLKVVSRTHNN